MLWWLLAACSGGGKPETGADDSAPEAALDYADDGSFGVNSEDGESTLPTGCDMAWTRYTPEGAAGAPVVVLVHGFARDRENMAGWGRHLASWGLDVITPDLCHASFTDVDHAQNGADLLALSEALQLASPQYVGHSAGGLAAFLAAAQSPDSAGVLGLDPVDNGSLGVDAASSLAAPAYAVIGEASACNADNNGVDMVRAAPQGRLLRAVEADHCDFEDPTDDACTAFCQGSNDLYSDDQIHGVIGRLMTGFLLARSGLDPAGLDLWTAGSEAYEAEIAEGVVVEVD